jgi:hypothetical protein
VQGRIAGIHSASARKIGCEREVQVRTASEQCLDDVQGRKRIVGLSDRKRGVILVPDVDDGVQGRAPVGPDDVDVGSAIDQEFGEPLLVRSPRRALVLESP